MLSIKTVIGTGAVLTVLISVIVAIVIKMIKNKKAGKSTCSCGCQGCAMSDICHKK